jgi:hypothetical protein
VKKADPPSQRFLAGPVSFFERGPFLLQFFVTAQYVSPFYIPAAHHDLSPAPLRCPSGSIYFWLYEHD